MNRDQLAIRAAMQAQGWAVDIGAIMRMGDKMAVIRPNRSIEVLQFANSAAVLEDKAAHFCYVQTYKGRGWLQLAVSIATAAAKTSLTSEQFGDILHAIGGGANGYTRPGYRNYYDAGEDWRPSLDAAADAGFVVHGGQTGVYYVTPKGAAEVGCAGCLEQK